MCLEGISRARSGRARRGGATPPASPPARDRPQPGPGRYLLARRGSFSAMPAPASMRIASPNDRPSLAARRSIASNLSSVRRRPSWSISTHLPRIRANPSECARSRLISAAERLSPSSVTSMRKSSSASSPKCDGACPPTVAFTCGRAGRFIRQLAGIRTATPALSIAGTSFRNCSACCGLQRNG